MTHQDREAQVCTLQSSVTSRPAGGSLEILCVTWRSPRCQYQALHGISYGSGTVLSRHMNSLSNSGTIMILVFTDEKTKLPGCLHPLPGQIPHSKAKKRSPPPTGSGFLNMKLQHHLTQMETTSLFPLAEPGQWPQFLEGSRKSMPSAYKWIVGGA